jgi:hypothetical protein
MTVWVQWAFIVASFVLQAMVIQVMLRGVYRRYPFAFAYSIVLFLTTMMDTARWMLGSVESRLVPKEFYQTEVMRQFFLFAAVISFIDCAIGDLPYRPRLRLGLVGVAIMTAVASVHLHTNGVFQFDGDSSLVVTATKVARDLSFSAVILNLLLWSLLLARKSTDRTLLLVTGGLGLQFTGDAIGQSMRQLAQPGKIVWLLWVGNLLVVCSHLLRVYVWWEAFRKAPHQTEENAEALGPADRPLVSRR